MIIIDVEQGSQQWFDARSGVPTGSRFGDIVDADGNLKKPRAKKDQEAGKLADAVNTYIDFLLAEPYADRDSDGTPVTSAMQYGIDTEVRARLRYDLMANPPSLREAGFILHDSKLFGCSPDALIFSDIGREGQLLGGLECKCPTTQKHIRYLREGVLPDEYKAQVHGGLVVTGAKWWDFMSYHEKLEPLYVRVVPDEYTANLEKTLFQFADILEAERQKFSKLA